MDYHLEEHRARIAASDSLLNAYSPESLRILISHILKGGNYRLITERNTKEKLFLHYVWLVDVYKSAKEEFGDYWQTGLLHDLEGIKRKSPEQKNLYWWLNGVTNKTATNLDIKSASEEVLDETKNYFDSMFQKISKEADSDLYWLMLISGASTLTIRGSDKSRVGKQVERVLVKSMLHILGFTLNTNYWLNIQRDAEVGRETDAEVQTRRGRIRIEVGLCRLVVKYQRAISNYAIIHSQHIAPALFYIILYGCRIRVPVLPLITSLQSAAFYCLL